MKEALLRLFNGVFVDKKIKKKIPDDIMKRTIKNGYVLDPRIRPYDELLDIIENIVGISGEKLNASFHKSWKTVQDTPVEILVIQQIIHYMTTYGFENLGIYDERTVYIPNEILEIPEIIEAIPLIAIRAMNRIDVKKAIIVLAGSGIALSQETLDDIMSVITGMNFKNDIIKDIKNRELTVMLNDFFEIIPTEPVEYLRYLISKLTDQSLLIKNGYLISLIKESNGKFLDTLLKSAPDNLAEIFFRFKPLFLAMKSISRNKTFFNQLRKKADHMHKPLKPDYLNNVTAMIKQGKLDHRTLSLKLDNASFFRKARLLYALGYRFNAGKSIVYKVRNGRGWVDDFSWKNTEDTITSLEMAQVIIMNSIAYDLKQAIKPDTVFYIPDYIDYTLPATEKQFTGHYPSGTNVCVDNDLIVGIHWENVESHRIDLDLSTISLSGKIGWDSDYRDSEKNVLFSGDITNAPLPHGATELFYIKKPIEGGQILMVNFYNYMRDVDVPAKIIVAQEEPKRFGNNYMVNPNNVLAEANIVINTRQTMLGVIIRDGDKNRVFLSKTAIGNGISARNMDMLNKARDYELRNALNAVSMRFLLNRAGFEVVNEMQEGAIDFSPQALDKNTFLETLLT